MHLRICGQRGFTLLELLPALAITALLAAGISGTVFQVIRVEALSLSRMAAVTEAQNAVHWMIRDAQMAQTVTVTTPPPAGSGFPLTLNWVELDGTQGQVVYSVQTSGLLRTYSRAGVQQSQTTLMKDVNVGAQMTNCRFLSPLLTVKVTATLGGVAPATETRSFDVLLRSPP